ncbi:unnamed protein product [Phytophthora fragariaefolia]|uniref:Unnamed protein product n=1 Tax=Phytophthora fragariaefolia TaxID=1490495 RepID=A0A9W7D138_9STRA|nr:unnamed protein product [Phytophthora fragariaefolia]
MDQTAIYASTSAYTTVEDVGVRVVPALTAASDSQRITMAVLVRADGVVLPPHFVLKGKPGGKVEKEIQSYVPLHMATCLLFSFDARYIEAPQDGQRAGRIGSHGNQRALRAARMHWSCSAARRWGDVAAKDTPPSSFERLTNKRRFYMFDHALRALNKIFSDTVRHSFDKAGPFFGCTSTTDVQYMLEEARLLSVVDARDNDTSLIKEVISEVDEIPIEAISV